MVLPIETLYLKNRFPSGPSLLFILLYTPIGIIIFLLRLFMSLQLFIAASILPNNTAIRSIVLRILFCVMGMIVREECVENKNKKCGVITANHITPFDHLAVSVVLPCLTPSVYDLPPTLSTLLCYRDLGVTHGREILRVNGKAYLSNVNNPPLLLHPEGATTSGKLALMKYGSWAFELNDSVLVTGLKVWRVPFLPVAPSVLGASWAADLCFMLFSPITIFSVTYVGEVIREQNESIEQFAARVQEATANSLGIQSSNHSVADKVEYMKRLAREIAESSNPLLSPEVHVMAMQVREVLPHISLDQIKRDIVRTQNVDLTITNFLEGTVPEPVPEPNITSTVQIRPVPSPATTWSSPNTSSSSSVASTSKNTLETTVTPSDSFQITGNLSTAAKSFGKSPNERMSSFQHRKEQLIQNARRKFIEKHGLQLPDQS